MNVALRTVLLAHIDGPVPIVRHGHPHHGAYCKAVNDKLITEGHPKGRKISPQLSYITEAGRAALCKALGAWADSLAEREQRLTEQEAAKTPEMAD